MKIHIIFLAIAAIIAGCGGSGNDTSESQIPETNLVLYPAQSPFTTPSRFEISSSEKNIRCTGARLIYSDRDVDVPVSSGVWFPDLKKVVCPLGNIPEDINNSLGMYVNYIVNESSDVTVEINDLASRSNSVNFSSAISLNNQHKNFDTRLPLSTNIYDFELPMIDSSGAVMSVQYILKNKYGIAFTESEIMNQLFTYGETDNIIARRGFSLLDMKRVFEHNNVTAQGYLLPSTTTPMFSTEVVDNLSIATPFLSAIDVYGSQSFFTVVEVTSQVIIGIHPILGYIEIPVSDLENGHFLTTDSFILMLTESAQ